MAAPFTHTVTSGPPTTLRDGRTRIEFRCSAGDLEGSVSAAPPEAAGRVVDAITEGHAASGLGVHTVTDRTCTAHGEQWTGPQHPVAVNRLRAMGGSDGA